MRTKNSNLLKMISLALCTTLTIHMGTALTGSSINAADNDPRYAGSVDITEGADGSIVNLSRSGGYSPSFDITKEGDRYHIVCTSYASDDSDVYVDKIDTLKASCSVTIKTSLTAKLHISGMESVLTIDSGCTVNCGSIGGRDYGGIANYGTLIMPEYDSSDSFDPDSPFSFDNYGTLCADSVDISSINAFRSLSGSEIRVSDSFYKGEEDLAADVVATSHTTYISSAGGSFTLKLGEYSKTIEGDIYGTAGDILYEDTTTSFSIPDDAKNVYIGQDYDFTPYALVAPDTYTGTPYIEYADPTAADSTYYAPDRPSVPGTYNARAVAPVVDGFNASTSESDSFNLEFLPLSEVGSGSNQFTVEGIVNGNYVPGDLTFVPADGFKIKSSADETTDFADSLTLSQEQLYMEEDVLSDDVNFSFKRNSDEAETDTYTLDELSYSPSLDGLIFDTDEPMIGSAMCIDDGAMLETSIEDGSVITTGKLTFTVYDENLDEVVCDGVTYTEDDFTDGACSIELTSTAGESKAISFTATDKAGKELSLSFTLNPQPVDPELTVTVPDDLHVGDDYDVDVDTNSDGAVSYSYKTSDGIPLEDLPSDAGSYVVTVYVAATDLYNASSATVDFEIVKYDADLTFVVPASVYAGDDYDITVSSDSDGTPVVTYRYDDVEGTPESSDKPSTAGNYTVLLVIPATDSYNEITAERSLTIIKRDTTCSVSVPDTYAGEDYEPEVSCNSDGTVTVTYRNDDVAGSEFTVAKPVAAGHYTVKAEAAETDGYYGSSATDTFTISRRDTTCSVSVPDTYVGEEYEPDVSTNSNGTVTVVYRNDDVAGSDFTAGKPSAAGHYTVKVEVAESDGYLGSSATDTFTISKRTATVSVSVPDTHTGEDYDPEISINSDGTVTVTYLNTDAAGSVFTPAKPTATGHYTVKVEVAETDRYTGASATDNFTISKRTATASVYVPDTMAGESYEATLTTNSDGKRDALIEYKLKSASDTEYTRVKPSARGTYTVRATVPETFYYLGVSCRYDFTIGAKTASSSVTVKDPYVGLDYTPVITTDSDGKSRTTFEYKHSGAPDLDYTTVKPTESGNYTVRATVPATDLYDKSVCTAEFSIKYLEVEGKAYDLAGITGNNDFFTSDVDLKAPDGYTISSTFRGEYAPSIPYSDDLNVIYLRRNDGALTSAIAISTRPMIDKDAPEIKDQGGSLADGSTLYVKDITITASDDNLLSLTVNGKPVDLTVEGNIITLSPGNGFAKFVITAEDKAGLIRTIEFVLMAEWLKDRVIPADLLLPLQAGEGYILNDGKWVVTTEQGGDPTVYNGGMDVYVNGDGNFTFTSVT